MKTLFLTIGITVVLAHPFRDEAVEPPYRYAYSCDGYNQDRDDVAGSEKAWRVCRTGSVWQRMVRGWKVMGLLAPRVSGCSLG